MDEKRICDHIRQSANAVHAPESLEPAQVEDLIQEREQERKRKPAYRIGAAAAAFLAFAALWTVDRGIAVPKESKQIERTVETEQGQEEAAAKTQAGEGQQEAATTEAAVERDMAEAGFAHVENEDTLYEALAGIRRKQEYSYDRARGERSEELDMGEAALQEGLVKSEKFSAREQDYSETNLQEAGVDEGDVVKTDGTYIYASYERVVHILRARGEELEYAGEIRVAAQEESIEEFYIDADRLYLVTTGGKSSWNQNPDDGDTYEVKRKNVTKLYTYDIGDRSRPKLAGSVEQEGSYQTSRKQGEEIYLFTNYVPDVREAKERSSYLPEVAGAKMAAEDIYLPEYAEDLNYLVISAVDARQPDRVSDRVAVVSAVKQYYVSEKNIYICNSFYENDRCSTQIMKFCYEEGSITPRSIGDISGYLNDSFSMNEYKGYLRVVATDWNEDQEFANLYVLDGNLAVYAMLGNIAPGESIKSARFFGDAGYFVTFRDTDPLFSVDLGNPAKPKLLGKLKVTGFSSYLHFYGEDRLLGIGYEVDPETGMYQGVKLSMFDISDPAKVTELGRYVVEDAYECRGLRNYKEILVQPDKNLIGFACEDDYLVFSYEEGKGFVKRLEEAVCKEWSSYGCHVRGLYIKEMFYLSGSAKIQAYRMQEGFAKAGKVVYEEDE